MSDVPSERAETTAAILLSVAALATSWAGYQATKWSGDQIQHANESTALRAKATRASTRAGQAVAIDVGLFNSWLVEHDNGNARLANFMAARFRPEFKTAFDTWMRADPFQSPTAPSSPFALPGYRLQWADSADQYESAADSNATLSAVANGASDAYVLDAVILATVMFFASAAQRHMRIGLRWVLIVIASAACLGGIARLFMLPRG